MTGEGTGQAADAARLNPAAAFLGIAALVGLIAYAPGFRGAILPDDVRAILENPSILSLWPLSGPLSPPLGNSLSGRPVANFTFAVNYAIGGFNFFGYHLVNFFIHLCSSLVLFAILRRTFSSPGILPDETDRRVPVMLAGFTALAWLSHPIATQAVTHLTQRVESLMALFFLLTFHFSLKGFSSAKKARWHVPALGAFFLGLGTKEVIVAAPFLILGFRLVIDRVKLFGELRSNALLYAGFALGLLLMAIHVSRGEQMTSASAPYDRLDYFFTQTLVIFHYLRLTAFPHPLCYDYRLHVLGLSATWPFTAAFLALAAETCYLCAKRKPAGFALAWFLVILLPTSSFLPLPQTMADYRPYLSSAGILALAAVLAYSLARRFNSRVPMIAVIVTGCMIIAAFGILTHRRNLDYESAEILWADTAKKRPKNYLAHYNLGTVLLDQGRFIEAAGSFEKAVTYNHLYYEAFLSWGVALARMGRLGEAGEKIGKAVSIKPDYPEARLSLGSVLAWSGKTEEAIAEFKRALDLKPGYVNAHLNLGLALGSLNRREEAKRHLEAAHALAPERADISSALEKAR